MLEIGGQESLLFLYDGILLVFRGALKEFKETIVSLYETGKSVTDLSREHGLANQTIYKWIKVYSKKQLDRVCQGSQYTSNAYNKYLEKHEISHSYSEKGSPYDNSCIESFHATLKKECIYAENSIGYKDFDSCYQSLFQYIEGFYNSRRRHRSLDYLSPNDYEKLEA